MNAILKAMLAVCLFLGAWLCIYGYQTEELVKISLFWSAVISFLCGATFVYFAFIDIKKK